MAGSGKAPLENPRIHVKARLGALWASLMFCYIYGDYFGLYAPGKLAQMLAGRMEPLGAVTQGVLVGTSAMMAVPALMVSLSLLLRPAVSRWANVMLALAYAGIMLMTMPGAWLFYQLFGVVEIVLSLAIAWTAWRWPRQDDAID